MPTRKKMKGKMNGHRFPASEILNYKEAVQSLEDVQHFLESRGYIEEALHIGSEVDTMTILKLKSSKQTILHDYWV